MKKTCLFKNLKSYLFTIEIVQQSGSVGRNSSLFNVKIVVTVRPLKTCMTSLVNKIHFLKNHQKSLIRSLSFKIYQNLYFSSWISLRNTTGCLISCRIFTGHTTGNTCSCIGTLVLSKWWTATTIEYLTTAQPSAAENEVTKPVSGKIKFIGNWCRPALIPRTNLSEFE